jgi:Sulfatase
MLRPIKSFRLPARLSFLRSTPVRYVFDALVLLSCATALNAWLNVRYPLPTSMGSNFLLAIEVPVAFAVVSLARRIGLRLGWWFFLPVSIIALLVRLFMAADNIAHRYVYRDFRVPLDLHLVPEFFRLMYDTSNAGKLTTYATLFFAFLALSVAMIWFILWYVHKSSERPGFRYLVLGLVVLSAGAVAAQEAGGPTLYSRELSQRVNREIQGIAQLPAERKKILRSIADVRERIGKGNRLDKLQGNNVLFIFVESYGRTAFVQPKLHDLIEPYLKEMEQSLEADGFHVASDFVTSPTYGGFSWFAHYTVDTGVKVISHLHSQLLDEQNPVALADFFRDAGYLPIAVAPGTSRAWPGMDDQFGFRNHYFSWEFGYRGPKYGWATMADQFVLYHVQKAEIEKAKQPLFIQYALISSHAPWNDIPRYVEDWSTLGNGAILHQAGRDRFESSWEKPDQILDGYAAGIKYEMRVIEGYLKNFVKDDTLVFFVGDHQPHQGVTGPNNLTWSVPAHVVSRNADFVAPFLRRGYVPGMVPDQPMPHVGMERFMEEFLSDFSTEPLAVDPGIWPPAKKRMDEEQAKLR